MSERWHPVTESLPPDGTWCWTWGHGLIIAKRDKGSAGGWTNEDTWEDFDDHITHWQAIPTPQPPIEEQAP